MTVMKTNYTEVMSKFWMTIVEKLNSDTERRLVLSDVIQELCQYFDFGCGFIFVSDHQETFNLYESFQTSDYYTYLDNSINLMEELGTELYRDLHSVKCVIFDCDKEKTELEEALSELFQAESMILVPVNAKGVETPAFIGMLDRRGRRRNENQDLQFAYFLLSVIANYISTMVYRQKNEGAMRTLRSVLDNTGLDVYVVDFHTDEILYVNRSMANNHGGEEQIIGKKCWEVFFKRTDSPCEFCPKHKTIDENEQPTEPYTWNYYRTSDHTWRRIISSAFYWIDGRLASVMSDVDITENMKNEEKIRRYAEYDTLTDLQNRHKLLLDCDDRIEYLKQQGEEGYLIFGDLDKFKEVNDQYGHQVGDELLRAIGNYFEENELTRGRVYRYAGDEFVILCLNDSKEQVDALLKEVYEDFQVPWKLSVGELECKISLGVTCYPKDAETTSDLLHSADMAMYAYKKSIQHE